MFVACWFGLRAGGHRTPESSCNDEGYHLLVLTFTNILTFARDIDEGEYEACKIFACLP